MILETPLRRKLDDLRLDSDIRDALLAEMQRRFGQERAWELAGEEWLLDWARWGAFVEEVQLASGSWSAGFLIEHVGGLMKEFLFALFRVVASQEHGPQRSNAMALQALRAVGFSRGEAGGDGNNCLADSLLQLLMSHGFVAEGVDRVMACRANREHLETQAHLVPRDIHGFLDFGGYLQHDRHAQPTLEFFFDRFGCSEDLLPSAGFRVVVHARSDDDEHPGAVLGRSWNFICLI